MCAPVDKNGMVLHHWVMYSELETESEVYMPTQLCDLISNAGAENTGMHKKI
jgi:hypothetical protein